MQVGAVRHVGILLPMPSASTLLFKERSNMTELSGDNIISI